MNKKLVPAIIAVLVTAVAVLGFLLRNGSEARGGIVINNGGRETVVAWDAIAASFFEGELIDGKGEVSHNTYEGIELRVLLESAGIEVSEAVAVTATSEDNYAADLRGAEILEPGKIYVALTKDGRTIEGIEGGQGAQLVVFGDPNSKRAVRYLKALSIEQLP